MVMPTDADDQIAAALRKIASLYPGNEDYDPRRSPAVVREEHHLDKLHELSQRIGECTDHATQVF